MRYILARFREEDRAEIYRIYVTEALRVLCGGKKSYMDIVEPLLPGYQEETRTSDEIIAHISDTLSRLGGN